jgi:amyloid beta precursor protein binding protein 1
MATEDKYDRQLRLWGPHGQKKLMECSMLLIGADGVGTETMKNLVLPGVGKFTILDGKTVSSDDLSNNFFVTPESVGRPRAEVVVETLCEMNEDVTGDFVVDNPKKLLLDDIKRVALLQQFQMVIVANQEQAVVRAVAKTCWDVNIPLMVVRAYGMIGYMRSQVHCHEIIESKPDGGLWDLRIANSFKELEDFALSIDLNELDSVQHKHVPFVVILCQVLNKWKMDHGGAMPTWSDKAAMVKAVEAMSDEYYPTGGFLNEESRLDFEKFRGINYEDNFKEARKEVSKAWVPKKLSYDLVELTKSYQEEAGTGLSEFGLLARALGTFMDKFGGEVPLAGGIPDMVSSTDMYTKLQGIFEAKAASDKKAFADIVAAEVASCGYPRAVEANAIDLFCAHVFDAKCIRLRSLEEEVSRPNTDEISWYDESPAKEQTPIMWYLALMAVDRFHEANGYFPGAIDSDGSDNNASTFDQDIDAVHALLQTLVAELKLPVENFGEDALSRKHAQEITRFGAVEMHNTAAVIGGLAAQEAVKLITHQYTPLNNTYIYNGIACCGAVYSL